jgi:hypothetical protein
LNFVAGLLRQPGGFEGVGGVIDERLKAIELTISHLKEPTNRLIERDPALSAMEMDSAHHRDAISSVVPLVRNHGPLVEVLINLSEVTASTFTPMQDGCAAAISPRGSTHTATRLHAVGGRWHRTTVRRLLARLAD